MFRPFALMPAVLSLLVAGVARAEDAPAPEQPQTVQEAPAEAGAPATDPVTDRLPTAERPGYWQRNPVTLPKMTMPKPDWTAFKPRTVHVGGAVFNTMLGVQASAMTDKGVFYTRLGRFIDLNEGIAVHGGWRKPITGTVTTSGYSGGIFVGHIIGDTFNGRAWNRLGAGGDFSYQWVNDHTLKVLSVGVGVGEERAEAGVPKKRAEPTAFFSYSVGLKLF